MWLIGSSPGLSSKTKLETKQMKNEGVKDQRLLRRVHFREGVSSHKTDEQKSAH